MDLEDRFPALANFLGAYFPDAEAGDEEVVALFRQATLPEDLEATRAELAQLLSLSPLPRAEVSRLSLRRLDDEAAARAWLAKLQGLLGR